MTINWQDIPRKETVKCGKLSWYQGEEGRGGDA